MPRLTVLFVRASLIYLLLAVTFGALMLANKGVMISPAIWALLPVHIELAFVGWMVQLAMGVVFWILPRFSRGAPRGNERLSWAAFSLLNAGIVLVVLQIVVRFQWLPFAGRILEGLALALFTAGNWRRVKPLALSGPLAPGGGRSAGKGRS
ncbi:MAG: hypothetical protein ACM3QS_05975 [Bacteroidota bacterium]